MADRIKPAALRQGDLLAVVAPASGVVNPSTIHFGRQLLERAGFAVKLGSAIGKKHGYLAGRDESRAHDLLESFANKAVKGIICLRGGYGTMRLLNQLDYQLIKANPKALIGFSDITALHLAITKKTGLVTFHGPVLNSLVNSQGGYTVDWLFRLLTDPKPAGLLPDPPGSPALVTIRGGTASGKLVGGNLTMICSLLGTPYEIETRNKILFLEEVGEEPYRVDRMLTQLSLAGKFEGVRGIIFGESVGCTPQRHRTGFYCTFSLEEVLLDRFQHFPGPVLLNLACGHGREKLTLPIQIEATLQGDEQTLLLREGAVKPS